MKILNSLVNGLARTGQFLAGESNDNTGGDARGWFFRDINLMESSRKSAAGPNITPDNALTLSTYFACIRNIAEDMGKMPLKVYEGDEINKTFIPDHPVQKLLNRPNPEMGGMTFREQLQQMACGRGNGYAEIQTTYGGTPIAIYPIHPARVTPVRVNGNLRYRVFGTVSTPEYSSFASKSNDLAPEEVLHIRGLGSNILGYSVARLAAESIGLALGAETFGASLFGNGAHPHGVLNHPNKLSDIAYDRLRESIRERHAGAVNANKPMILEEGMTWQMTSITPEDAQFLTTRQFQVEEICRWFRMPPHKVQHLLRATFSNIESQALEYVTDTLTSWATRWEQEVDYKLIKKPGYFSSHYFENMLRADHAARVAYYSGMRNVGAINSDEIRNRENMNKLPAGKGGDKYIVQSNFTTLEKVGETPPPPAPAPGGIKNTPTPPPQTVKE